MPYEANIPAEVITGIPVYGLLAAIGFVLAFIWVYIEWNRKGLNTWNLIQVVTVTTLFALYGAKLWYMIFDPVNAFAGINDALDLLIVIFIPATGRSIIGTVVFAPVGIWVYHKINPEVKIRETMDILLPAILIGQFVARWGNFANHSVFGQEVSEESLMWLPQFIRDNMYIYFDGGEAAYRSPLFLYESFADLIIFVFIFVAFKTNDWFKAGTAGASYIALYGMLRSIFELMRDPSYIMHWGPIPTSFVTAIILFIVGIGLMIKYNW